MEADTSWSGWLFLPDSPFFWEFVPLNPPIEAEWIRGEHLAQVGPVRFSLSGITCKIQGCFSRLCRSHTWRFINSGAVSVCVSTCVYLSICIWGELGGWWRAATYMSVLEKMALLQEKMEMCKAKQRPKETPGAWREEGAVLPGACWVSSSRLRPSWGTTALFPLGPVRVPC